MSRENRPYTPRSNGKAEHFIQTSLHECADVRHYQSSAERINANDPMGGVVDADMNKVPAAAPFLVAALAGNAVPDAVYPAELLGVDVVSSPGAALS